MAWFGPYTSYWAGIVSDGTYIYAAANTEVIKIKVSDGTLTGDSPILTGLTECGYMALDGTNLYVSDGGSNTIWKIDLTNITPPESLVLDISLNYPLGLAVYNNKLYIANNPAISSKYLISQVDLSNNQGIQNWAILPTNTQAIGLVTDSSGKLYISTYYNPNSSISNIYVVSTLVGPNYNINFGDIFSVASCYGMVIYNDYLYCSYNYNSIAKISLYSGFPVINIESVSSADSLCVVGTDIYCSDDFTSAIYKFSLLPPPPPVICFKEGSTLLSFIHGKEEYVPIENIRSGTLVKTLLNGYVPVHSIGTSKLYNSGDKLRGKNRLYRLTKDAYPELTEDLIITGCHSLLVEELSEKQRSDIIDELGRIMITDDKYRLMAIYDERADTYEEEGLFNIWHLALEHDDERMNYGVYANGGLLVETTSRRMLANFSGMTLV